MRHISKSMLNKTVSGIRLWRLFLLVLISSSLSLGAVQYQISWYTIDGGGGTSSSEVYTLTGTIGQPDAQVSSGGNFKLTGGFWSGDVQPPNQSYTGPYYDQWLAVGSPACWCAGVNPRQCHGDADGAFQGDQRYWVSSNDLDILISAWNKSLQSLSSNQICADFDHLPQGQENYRVSTNDLDILIANWNLASGPAPDCP